VQHPMRATLFICHASEDKAAIARPLAEALRNLGLTVWYDEFSLILGDSLRRSIERGLSTCDFGLVILSRSFFTKEWPRKELDGLTAREVSEKRKVILPIWHDIDGDFVTRMAPMLADKVAISTNVGLPKVVSSITDALGDYHTSRMLSLGELEDYTEIGELMYSRGLARAEQIEFAEDEKKNETKA
jgi:TIR domain